MRCSNGRGTLTPADGWRCARDHFWIRVPITLPVIKRTAALYNRCYSRHSASRPKGLVSKSLVGRLPLSHSLRELGAQERAANNANKLKKHHANKLKKHHASHPSHSIVNRGRIHSLAPNRSRKHLWNAMCSQPVNMEAS